MKGIFKKLLVYLLIYALVFNGAFVSFAQALELDSEEVEVLQEEEEEEEPLEESSGDIDEETADEADDDQIIDEELIDEEIIEEEVIEEEIIEEEIIEEGVVEDDKLDEKGAQSSGPTRLTQRLGGLEFTLEADEGVLELGSQLMVSELDGSGYREAVEESRDMSFDRFRVFDISLVDGEGNILQPKASVDVKIAGLSLAKELELFYLGSSQSMMRTRGISEVQELSNWLDGGGLNFRTDHFSIYGVGEVATARFNFYQDSVLLESQIVRNGQVLLEPQLPEEAGKSFKGWRLEGESSFFDFSNPIVVSESSVARLDAVFEEGYFVYFNYKGEVIATKLVQPGDSVDASGVGLVVNESGKTFRHWSLMEAGPAYDFSSEVNEDISLYAVTWNRWKVSFDSQGGSQILPKYVVNNQALGGTGVPFRAGYSFLGWNSQADGSGISYTGSSIITGDLRLYAQWKAEVADYSLVYWQENADDGGFTYKETVTRAGLTGSVITVDPTDRQNNRYNYFSYRGNDTGKLVKGDGSTIVNVYYSRKSYTVRFNLNRTNSKMTIGGVTYDNSSSSSEQYSITAKYDADIADVWPTASNVPSVGSYKFFGWVSEGISTTYVSKRMNMTPDLFNSDGTERIYDGSWSTSLNSYTLHYMIERLPEDTHQSGDKSFDGKWYREDMTYNQAANATGDWSAKEIKGVTNVGRENYNAGSGDVYFYYKRNLYDLDFHNPGKIASHKILYGRTLADKDFVPARPASVDSSFAFMGWFESPLGVGEEFDFGGLMPEHNIALYAKWAPPVHDVKYFLAPGEGDFSEIRNIAHGTTISEGDLVDRRTPVGLDEGDFIGWFWYLDEIFVEFDFSLPIERDGIVLYPVWDSPGFTISYEAGGAEGAVPLDSAIYKLGSGGKIKSQGFLHHPLDKVFLGWLREGSSDIFYPGQKINLSANVVLVAQWGDRSAVTELVYDGNGGLDGTRSQIVINLLNNELHEVMDNSFLRQGYEFIGWNTNSHGSGRAFAPGARIIVDNSSSNILYAQWREIAFTISYLAEEGGFIEGESSQQIARGGSSQPVEAKAGEGYFFNGWDDGENSPQRHEENVQSSRSYTAKFSRKHELVVKAASASKIYDGTPLKAAGYSESGLVPGDELQVTVSGSITSVGSTPNKISSVRVMRDGVDVTHHYKIIRVDGSLKIGKRPLGIGAASAEKIYDGTPLTTSGYSIVSGSLAAGQILDSVVVSGSQTEVGSSASVPSGAVIKASGMDVSSNYKISYLPGVLRVLKAELAISKKAKFVDVDGDGRVSPDDKLNYTILVTNTGDVTIKAISVSDPLLGLNTNIGSLAPGNHKKLTASLVINQAMIDAGLVLNKASVQGKDSSGRKVKAKTQITTPLARKPGVEIVKSGTHRDANGNGLADAGEKIVYQFTITNTGNVTLKNLQVQDALLGFRDRLDSLAPGESRVLEAFYSLSQEDIEKGRVVNRVSLVGKDPSGKKVSGKDEEITELTRKADLLVSKKGIFVDVDGDGRPSVGDRIDYRIRIKNIGNVILTNIQAQDPMIELDEVDEPLLPGEVVFLEGSYELVQEDIDRGWVHNRVEVEADELDEPVGDEELTELSQEVDISVTKQGHYVDLNGDGRVNPGDIISYEIHVENTGNTSLVRVVVEDRQIDFTELIASLAPGEGVLIEKDYLITQEDIDRGQVENHVKARGELPRGVEPIDDGEGSFVEDEDEDITVLDHSPSVELIKVGVLENNSELASPGDLIHYTISLENTGNVTLYDLVLEDLLLDIHEEIPVFAPGDFAEFTGSYALTQDDIDNGLVINVVGVHARDRDLEEVEEFYFEGTEILIDSALEIEKNAIYEDSNGDGLENEGDRLVYTIRVTNTGNSSLWNLVIRDDLVGLLEELDELEAGEMVEFTRDYRLDQADIDRGYVVNRALASGFTPLEELLEEEVEVFTELEQLPVLELMKTASLKGDSIHYKVILRNKGNITLTDIRVQDPLINLDELVASLAPGESLSLEGVYKLKTEDYTRGYVINKASAEFREMGDPVETELRTDVEKRVKKKLPSTGAAPLDMALFSGLGLLVAAIGLLRKKKR